MKSSTEQLYAAGARRSDSNRKQRLQLAEEQLKVRTRPVPAGVVRLHKRVVTETRTIEVTVRREELVVEHVSAHDVSQGPRGPADTPNDSLPLSHPLQPDESFCIPLIEEEILVQTPPTVVEEVVVGKRLVATSQVVSATVRREQARVRATGDVDLKSRPERIG